MLLFELSSKGSCAVDNLIWQASKTCHVDSIGFRASTACQVIQKGHLQQDVYEASFNDCNDMLDFTDQATLQWLVCNMFHTMMVGANV
jgi:hypothetical protein